MSSVDLIPIQPEGEVPVGFLSKDDDSLIAEMAQAVFDITQQMYEQAGFVAPWGGYFATKDSKLVGTCGFKGSPTGGRVEIAYFTFPNLEGQGIATAMGEGSYTSPKPPIRMSSLPHKLWSLRRLSSHS